MMTYKYYEVRREICENKPDKILSTNRTFEEIKKIISFRFWMLFSIGIVAIITTIVFVFLNLYMWCLIPLGVLFLVNTITDWLGEKNYNVAPRKAELKKQKEKYRKYINKIQEILKNCDIEMAEQIDFLKLEAEEIISKFESRFNSVRAKIDDLIFAIPLAALFESFWSSKTEVNQSRLIVLLVWGLLVLSVIRISKRLYIHFNEIRKDYYLLQVLSELNYLKRDINKEY